MFEKLVEWLKMPVDEVPDDIAVCEFECSKTECRVGDWRRCERRLQACKARQREWLDRTH